MPFMISGGLRVDYIITSDGDVRLREMGGNALYAAGGACLWGERVMLQAKVGDNYPEEWFERLTGLGLGTSDIHRISGAHEQRTFYAYVDPHTRIDHSPGVHFARVGHPMPEELSDYTNSVVGQNPQVLSPIALRESDLRANMSDVVGAHVAPMGIVTQVELAVGLKSRGVEQVTVDPGEYFGSSDNEPRIRQICAHVDAFLPSELEIGLLFGTQSVHEAAEALASWGAPVVVIKRGGRGILVYERDSHRYTALPAYPTNVVDVTGAGDSFCGAFAVGFRRTGDPVYAGLMGIVAASFAIEGYGALYNFGIQRAEAEQRLAELSQLVRG